MVDHRFPVSVHIMTALAFAQKNGEGLKTSAELASSVCTDPTVVRRLVSRLAEANLVRSYKGKTGGLELCRPADKISLKEIYKAIQEKPLMAVPQKKPKKQCAISCAMASVMMEVVDGMEAKSLAYLNGIRLTDLVKKISGMSAAK